MTVSANENISFAIAPHFGKEPVIAFSQATSNTNRAHLARFINTVSPLGGALPPTLVADQVHAIGRPGSHCLARS